jgi:hypothetical protein
MAPAPTTAGDVVKGVGDAALSGASKVATGVVGAPIALANRLIAALSGGDPQMAADATHEFVNRHFGYDTQTPVGKHIGSAVHSVLAPLGESAQAGSELLQRGGEAIGIPRGETHGALSELGDITGTVGAAAPLAAGASASTEAATLAAQNAPAAVTKYGMRTLADHPVAAGAAGPSGTQAVSLHNQPLGNTILGAEAGVPHGMPLVPGENGSLAGARRAPGSVYDRMESSIPTAPLSPAATKLLNSAGTNENVLTAPSEATQTAVNTQRAKLTGRPLTGSEVIQTSRALRQEGGARLGSDDVEQQNLGSAQLGIARALEQHAADTLPAGSPVSLDQFQAARTALAKNYAVQGAVKGGNVDMQAIARMQQRDPDLLTGPMRDIADFANQHPAVTGLTNRIETPPSFANDLGKALGAGSHQGIVDRLFGASGVQAGARRVLTGSPGTATAAARQTPVSGLAGEFAPLEAGEVPLEPPPGAVGPPPPRQASLPLGPQGSGQVVNPTGGLTASPPTAPPPAAAGPPGQMSLADLLSHGVEQGPPPGLSLGPMGAPAQVGIPFTRDAAHEAGGLALADELGAGGPFKGQPMSMSDFAGVKSQGVPEDILARSRPSSAPEFADLGQRPNNASGESAASLEAQSRLGAEKAAGVQPVIFGDSGATSLLHDVTAVDRAPPKGHIILDANTGRVINGGGLKQSAVQALVNRWNASRLGEAF